MGVLIDSSVLIASERSLIDSARLVSGREDENVFISVVSASEMLHGVHRARDAATRARRLSFVEGVLASIPVLQLDLTVARMHAQLWAELTSRGTMIGVHDSWLAATCLAHGLSLATGNVREFRRVPGLVVEEWT